MSPLIMQAFIDKLLASNSVDVHVCAMISLRTCVGKCQIFTFITSEAFESICGILASLVS